MDILKKELDIPEKYMTEREHSISATVHKQWIYGFLNLSPINFITHDALSPDEIAAQPSIKELGHNWTRIFIKVRFLKIFIDCTNNSNYFFRFTKKNLKKL